jgi:hypothetical protein
MDNIKKKPCKEFESDKWFLLDGSMPEEEKILWQSHLASCDKCRTDLSNLKEINSAYASLPEADIEDYMFKKMISFAASNANDFSQETLHSSFTKNRSLSEIFGFYRLAFGGAVLAAALILIFITFFNNPKIPEIEKRVPKELLAWDFPGFSNQLTSAENQILSLKTDEWDIYIVRKNNKEDWDNALRTIQNQIRKMKREAVSASM